MLHRRRFDVVLLFALFPEAHFMICSFTVLEDLTETASSREMRGKDS